MITEEQKNQFEDASKPLVKWLNENCHPHTTIVVTQTGSELLEGLLNFKTEEFLKD